jgi:hypothetical protein
LLEYVLTASPAVVACGEVARHLKRFGRRKICTCGRPFGKCPLWANFQHHSGKLKNWDHQTLTLALLTHISGRYAVMVDSSKTAWGSSLMPFRFHKRLSHHFLLVHVVRNPKAVCWSVMRTPRKRNASQFASMPLTRCLGAAIGWLAANMVCEVFGWLHPRNYIRIRYEDLTQSTEESLKAVFHKLSVQPPASIECTDALDNRHQLYGNRIRFRPLSPSDIKEDVTWRTMMPRTYRCVATSLCLPLEIRYGYVSLAAGI